MAQFFSKIDVIWLDVSGLVQFLHMEEHDVKTGAITKWDFVGGLFRYVIILWIV